MDANKDRRHRELARRVASESAAGAIAAVLGIQLGPAGVVLGAAMLPAAVWVSERVGEFHAEVNEAGISDDLLFERMASSEEFSDLFVVALRSATMSDLRAKRRLLAQAVVRALDDDAQVLVELRYVRLVAAVDTVDVRVLVRIDVPPPPANLGEGKGQRADLEGVVYPEDVLAAWPGVQPVLTACFATLEGAGLIFNRGLGTYDGGTYYLLTPLGKGFLAHLRELDDEADLEIRDPSP